MRIRTQQSLVTLISTLAIAIIAAALFNSIRQADRADQRSNFATDVVANGIAGLRLVAVEYIIARPERAKLQWQNVQESLTRNLALEVFDQPDEQLIIRELRQRQQYMQDTFADLVELDSHRTDTENSIVSSHEVEKRLVTQIMILTQKSTADATRLAKITNDRQIEAQHRTTWLVIILLVLIGLIILLNYVTALTQILTPIRKLKQGADAFALGEFNFRTNLKVNNELGALSQAFDQMAARLAESILALEHKSALLQETNNELESFSYSVSHDLRSPLRGIDGWGLALLEDYGPQLDTTAHEYVDRIRYETQRMGHLIDDLLQLARVTRSEIKRELVDLSDLAGRIAERLRQAHTERQIEFIIQPGITVEGDLRLLDIMLTNLFDNACKFTAPRTLARIEFGASGAEQVAGRLSVGTYFVRDNGVGFDMAHAQRLFGAFQRMHRVSEFPGTGIGLATVQRIVRRHGGKAWADANLGSGATFYFTLMQMQANPSISGAPSPTTTEQRTRHD